MSRSSFTETLRRVDDADLTPHQFRLVMHYWRVGNCWETIRTTAEKCGMSIGKVSETRAWLLANGWIKWVVEGDRTAVALCSPHEQTQQLDSCSRSPDEQRSPHEQTRSPGEQNPVVDVHQVNAILNGPQDLNGPREGGGARAREDPPTKKHPDPELAAMVNALVDATGLDGHKFWPKLSQAARELLEGGYTPAQLASHYSRAPSANGHWNWYHNDWRGKKGDFPRLADIWETISGAVKYSTADDWLDDIVIFEDP